MNYQMNWFSYGATSAAPKSSDFGLIVTANNTFDAPQRSVTAYGVQGLNGDVVIDNGKWNNTTISYTVHALRVTNETMNRIRAWLCVPTGYQRIFDSYDSAIFREGYFSGNISWIMTQLKKCGTATLTFIVKPQRFIKATAYGESQGESISNVGGQSTSIVMPSDVLPCLPIFKGNLGGGNSQQVIVSIEHGNDLIEFRRTFMSTSASDVVTMNLETLQMEVDGQATASDGLYILKYNPSTYDWDYYVERLEFLPGETYKVVMLADSTKMWRRTSII